MKSRGPKGSYNSSKGRPLTERNVYFRALLLEGGEEAWRVISEVIGGYWGFCGGHRRFGTLLVGFGFYRGSWRIPGSQKWDHRGIQGVLDPRKVFEGDLNVFVGPK